MRLAKRRHFFLSIALGASIGPSACGNHDDDPWINDGGAAASAGASGSAGSSGGGSAGTGGVDSGATGGNGTGAAGGSGATGGAGTGGTGGGSGATGGVGPGGTGGAGSDGGGGVGPGGMGGGGSAGTGGGYVDGGNCYTGTAPPPPSTVTGNAFDAWEGEPVRGCLHPAQSFPIGCVDSVVRGGSFSLTAAVCTGVRWVITVGSPGHQVACNGFMPTPANCWCSSGVGPGPGAAGASGSGCDAGAIDAARDSIDATSDGIAGLLPEWARTFSSLVLAFSVRSTVG